MDILIIDSDRGIQNYYRNLLESEFRSVHVRFAMGMNEAAETLAANRPDLVLTEIFLEEGSIFDFLGALVKMKIPVIIVSENYSERLIVECIRAGALDFLSKRFIKLGILPLLIKRALLEGDRWSKIQEVALGILHRPEYVALNRKIQGFLKSEELEKNRRDISRGVVRSVEYVEGQNYQVIFVYVQFHPTAEHRQLESTQRLAIQQRVLSGAIEMAEKLGGQLWTLKEDGCFFAFDGDDALEAALAAIQIHASLNVFALTQENLREAPMVNIGIARGQTVYRVNKGDIYCEALNLSAHMAIYSRAPNQILITEDLFTALGARAQKYFFRTDPFEGHPCYSYEPIA
ncbi:MAG: response regulator [Spirochaetales bacterium]|nr:response regulator [Spirochaetales bacterium]